MAKERRSRSGWIIGILVVLGLLWVGYWYAAHYVAESTLARLASAPVNGRTIGCADPVLGGFPFRLDVRCASGTYAEAGDRAKAEIGAIAATMPLYWPGSVEAKLDAPLTIDVPGLGVTLTANWSSGTATAGAGIGGVNSAGASFVGLKAENSGPLPAIGLNGISADAASASLATTSGGSYTLTANAKQLAVTRTDGTPIPVLDADVRATAVNVGALGTDPAQALLTWLRGKPSVTIDRLRIAAAGAIVSASGTLSLSRKGLLNGSILLQYNSIAALADLIETLKPGSRDKLEPALQGLQVMSKPVDTEDGAALQTTLTFTDGLIWLTIIPLPIDPIPPLRF